MSIEPQIPEEWSDAEEWAWKEIRSGRIADFHKRYEKELDPEKQDGWDDEQKDRRLSQAFLLTILTEESFCSVTPFNGVRINGACFEETVDLQYARLGRQLWLEHCRFHSKLRLMNLHVNGWFSLEGSWLGGDINLNGSVLNSMVSLYQVKIVSQLNLTSAKTGGDLYMDESTFKEVNLIGAKIGGYLNMSGSTFDGKLSASGTEVSQYLSMEKATFKEVDLAAAKIGGQLSMNDSTFNGKLDMDATEVGQHLFMHKVTFKDVNLTAAKIDGQLSMIGSTFDGKLIMDATEVSQHLFMRGKATFKEVVLTAAKIGGQLSMNGSTFDGKLTMGSIEVGQHLLMREKATFKEVDLMAAKIGGYLNMNDSTFNGKLIMEEIEIGQNLFARSTTFPTDQEVVINFARIGSNFDLSGATIRAIDLTATTITGELRLGSAKNREPTNWVKASRMVLRNTTVGAIQDADVATDSWPKNLELEGFAYSRLGGYGAEGTADISNRDSKWFIDWLDRDKTFSPPPYEQLANVLHGLGYPSKANAIRYEARKRSRRATLEQREGKLRGWPRWIGLTLLQYTIGYGLGTKYFRVLGWFGGITLIGFLVLLASIEKSNWNLFKMAWASFDQVLPIIKLNGGHEKFILENCSRWTIAYFYVQKLIGYILGGFLGAGLAGLTQKS